MGASSCASEEPWWCWHAVASPRHMQAPPMSTEIAQDLMAGSNTRFAAAFVTLLARVVVLAECPLDGVALEQEMARTAACSGQLHSKGRRVGCQWPRHANIFATRIISGRAGNRPCLDQSAVGLRFYATPIARFFDRRSKQVEIAATAKS